MRGPLQPLRFKSMVQWLVLRSGLEKGSLVAARSPIEISEEISELLLYGILLSQERGIPLSQVASHPALFPFKLQVNVAELRKRKGLQLQRHGDQSDFVALA